MPQKKDADGLNGRQARFCHEYLKDLNATQSAKRAGYSPRTCSVMGTKLVQLPKIQARISELKRNRARNLEISTDSVLRELSRIAFSDVRDVATWDEDSVALVPSGNLEDDAARAIAEVKAGEHGVGIKMHDKLRALDTMAKHLEFDELRQKIDELRGHVDGGASGERKRRRNYPTERKPARKGRSR